MALLKKTAHFVYSVIALHLIDVLEVRKNKDVKFSGRFRDEVLLLLLLLEENRVCVQIAT